MTRYAFLALAAALVLIVAACNGDDTANDVEPADDLIDAPADDATTDDTDVVVPDDDDAVDAVPEEDDDPLDAVPEDDDDEVGALPDDDPFDPDAMQPGMFFDLTFEEADEISPFALRQPEEVPENIELHMIMGMASPDAPEEVAEEEATTITMSFIQAPADEMSQAIPMEFTQSSELDMREGLPEEAEQEDRTVGDHEVTRVVIADPSGEQVVGYMWENDGVFFALATFLTEELDEAVVEQMVASVPAS